ncbi:hypothetical protein AB0D78_04155 [Streptomyces avermitilis]|uniref:hypothetical protein n=1 Tax=Streptomyces avermitilis TaxID=33903 RepID=UPI0033F77CB8
MGGDRAAPAEVALRAAATEPWSTPRHGTTGRTGTCSTSISTRCTELHSNDGIFGDAREIHIEYRDEWVS